MPGFESYQHDEVLADLLKVAAPKVPTKLKAAIAQFAKEHPEYGNRSSAVDQCRKASGEFCSLLWSLGMKEAVVDEIDVIDDTGHKAVRVGNIWIDWTRRQYDPKAPFPYIVFD
jgi:hypothetical protein